MSKKRRVFDIDLPDDLPSDADAKTFPAGKVSAPETKSMDKPRRGPMATAIGESRRSGEERASQEAAIREENDRLAHEHVRLKKLGLITDLIRLDQIDTLKLIRDRAKDRDDQLGELKESIKELGLSNPIRVEPRKDGRFELVQGFRRLSAFRQLLVETGSEEFAKIPATIMAQGETIEDLYRRMVDENLVRRDISFAEMANLAINYSLDVKTSETDPEKAVAQLFKSASYQKRSYIRAFIRLLESIGSHLMFAPEIPRSLGLALAAKMETTPGVAGYLCDALDDLDIATAEAELKVLRTGLDFDGSGGAETFPAGKVLAGKARKAKSVFSLSRPEGAAKCTASSGRLDIKLDKDFSTVDRRKLEAAVVRLLDELS